MFECARCGYAPKTSRGDGLNQTRLIKASRQFKRGPRPPAEQISAYCAFPRVTVRVWIISSTKAQRRDGSVDQAPLVLCGVVLRARARRAVRVSADPAGTANHASSPTTAVDFSGSTPGRPEALRQLGVQPRTTRHRTKCLVTRNLLLLPGDVDVTQPSDALTAEARAKAALNGLVLGLGAVPLLVGATAGLLPAVRATRMSPNKALWSI